MKNVSTRLQEYEKHASAAERGVVNYLLKQPENAGGISVHKLAEITFSSPSTIMRLCSKLGFEGYKELQKSLLYELALRKESGIRKTEDIKEGDSLEEIVHKVTYKNIQSLENTMKLVDVSVLEKCVEVMQKSKAIYLFGMGASLLVAKDAYLKFLRIHTDCFLSDDIHAQLLQAMNMNRDSVAIIISYSGMTPEMINCAEEIRKNDAPIILISRFEDSPLAKLADYNLCVASTEYIVRSGAMSSRISQLNVIDILYTAYVNQDFDKYMQQLERTHIKKEGR